MNYKWFEDASEYVSRAVGHPYSAVPVAVLAIAWVVTSFLLGINEHVTVVGDAVNLTLLFLLQRSANKNNNATQDKLDQICAKLGLDDVVGEDLEKTDEELAGKRCCPNKAHSEDLPDK
jgi:low affinity Fe/Cu permease